MGHKVNPLVFRLGISNTWSYNFKEPKNWIVSYLIYQLVSNHFLRYTIPHLDRTVRRNTRNNQGLVIMKGEKQTIANPLIKNSMLFSHLNSGSRNSRVTINCYFYDYGINYRKFVPKFVKYNQVFSNSPLKKYRRHPFWRKHIKFRGYPGNFYRWIKWMGASLWLFNFKLKTWNFVGSNLKLNLCWLRLSKKLNYFDRKKKIFFLNVWSNLLTGLYSVFKTLGLTNLYRRIYLLTQLISFVNFGLKLKNSLFFFKLFRTRYFFFKGFSKSLNFSLKSMLPSVTAVSTKFNAMKEKQMRSSLLTNLIIIKLGQYFRINSIIFPVTKWLKRHRNVLGFRIIVSGRLTRRERASHIIQSYKRMPLSSYKYKIDYNQDIKIMKFGMVGIKIYLFVIPEQRTSYYFFKFTHN